MSAERRVWLLFTSEEAKKKASRILVENGFILPECGRGYSILKSSLKDIDHSLSKAGFDMNTRYVQML